nr:cytidine deaminase [Spirochaeta thermophila]
MYGKTTNNTTESTRIQKTPARLTSHSRDYPIKSEGRLSTKLDPEALMPLDPRHIEALLTAAHTAAGLAYAPYSHIHVGAALLCDDGTIVQGANMENRSYGLTVCAERTALFRALLEGRRAFTALAIYSPDVPTLLTPCGACRQVLSEFLPPETPIVCHDPEGEPRIFTLGELYPHDSLRHLNPQAP